MFNLKITVMGYLDFLEQKIITIPSGIWSFLPRWLSLDFIRKNRQTPKLLQTHLPPADALNRRHCGQSQQSAVIKQRERLAESKILGAERKKRAKIKEKKAKPTAETFNFRRKKH